MSDSHKKRPRDDDDEQNSRPIISDMFGDIHWPCTFCGNHFTGNHKWQSLWGPKGRAYLCVKCQRKWTYGEKVANEMDKKDDKKDDKDDKKDDKKDDMDKKDESKIVDGNDESMIVDG